MLKSVDTLPTIGKNAPQVGGITAGRSIEPLIGPSTAESSGRPFSFSCLGFKQLRSLSRFDISRSVARFRESPISFLLFAYSAERT
jgi:hypothetical protein